MVFRSILILGTVGTSSVLELSIILCLVFYFFIAQLVTIGHMYNKLHKKFLTRLNLLILSIWKDQSQNFLNIGIIEPIYISIHIRFDLKRLII